MTGYDPSDFPGGKNIEEFAQASGVDPDNVLPLHTHTNPVTGQSVTSDSWPCPQCVALGRTEPLRYGVDIPDQTSVTMTEIPADRLEEYLATFAPVPAPGGHRARRRARRAAERQTRRGKR